MRQNLGTATSRAHDYSDKTYSDGLTGAGNVVGQSSSVDSEVALFSGTTGKIIKRATGSGLMRLASGVASVVSRTIDGTTFDGSANITVIAPGIHAATAKTTPVDADEFGIVDSAAANVLKKALFSDIKAALATWLQTLTATWSNKTLVNPTITNYTETRYAIGSSGTAKTLDLANGTVQTVTMTGNCTFTMPAQPGAGLSKSFVVLANTGAGGFTGTFTGVKWPAATAPVLTATAARLDMLTFIADGTDWFGSVAQNYSP